MPPHTAFCFTKRFQFTEVTVSRSKKKNGRNIRAIFRRVKWFFFSLKLFQITARVRKLISAIWYYLVDVNN